MDAIGTALVDEFAHVASGADAIRVGVRLLIAVVLAGVLGYERERRDSAAGLRTHMLVGLGAALFVIAAVESGMGGDDVSRVLQGIVAGIGFLGAGAILKRDDAQRVRGLTTAGSVWATAAIGVAVGLGQHLTAILGTAIALAILAVLLRLERRG